VGRSFRAAEFVFDRNAAAIFSLRADPSRRHFLFPLPSPRFPSPGRDDSRRFNHSELFAGVDFENRVPLAATSTRSARRYYNAADVSLVPFN